MGRDPARRQECRSRTEGGVSSEPALAPAWDGGCCTTSPGEAAGSFLRVGSEIGPSVTRSAPALRSSHLVALAAISVIAQQLFRNGFMQQPRRVAVVSPITDRASLSGAMRSREERTPDRLSDFIPPDIPPGTWLRSMSGLATYSGRSRKPLWAFRLPRVRIPPPPLYSAESRSRSGITAPSGVGLRTSVGVSEPHCSHPAVPTAYPRAMPLRPCIACGALTREGSVLFPAPAAGVTRQAALGRQAADLPAQDARTLWIACAICGSLADVEAAHADDFRLSDGSYEEGVGVPLCRKCHRKLDAAARRARRGRMG